VGAAVLRRPSLWPTAARQARLLAPSGWWRRWPPVPVPAPEWLRFRLVTAYGDPTRVPDPEDVEAWLRWCRTARRRTPCGPGTGEALDYLFGGGDGARAQRDV
jgi:hypothetical protein